MKSLIDLDTGESVSIPDKQWYDKLNSHLAEWYKVKQEKDLAADKEQQLRKSIVGQFSDPGRIKGTENIKLDATWACKITKQVDISFIKKEDGKLNFNEINKTLAAFAAYSPDAPEILSRLVTWEPKISVTEYNKLLQEMRDIIDKVVVTRPSSVSLELIQSRFAEK